MNNTDKKLDERIDIIKLNMNQDELSQEFKQKLIKKLENKEPRKNLEITVKNKNIFIHYKKYIVAIICFFIIITGYSLADDFENIILNYFSNIDKITKKAIEEGQAEYIDMDYAEDQGIGIKTNYIIKKDGDVYIALETKEGNKIGKIRIAEFDIIDEDKNIIYNSDSFSLNIEWGIYYNTNNIIFLKISNLKDIENISIIIRKIHVYNYNSDDIIYGNWKVY